MAEATANIGVIGLATMGSNLARNLAHHGNTVALFNRHYSRTEKLMNEHGTEGNFVPAETLEEFAASLKRPRTAIIMVKAGAPTDATIAQLEEVFEPGDIIVDGGNSFFKDTIKREKEVRAKGFQVVEEEGVLSFQADEPGSSITFLLPQRPETHLSFLIQEEGGIIEAVTAQGRTITIDTGLQEEDSFRYYPFSFGQTKYLLANSLLLYAGAFLAPGRGPLSDLPSFLWE